MHIFVIILNYDLLFFRLNDNTVRFGEERNFQKDGREERRLGEGERFGKGERFGEGRGSMITTGTAASLKT